MGQRRGRGWRRGSEQGEREWVRGNGDGSNQFVFI